jgi:hypothetical protein
MSQRTTPRVVVDEFVLIVSVVILPPLLPAIVLQ